MSAPDAVNPAWLAAALQPPRAAGEPPASGRLRVRPEDFRVEEQLGFDADGGTAHLLLKVEKTDANTLYVARALARAAGLRPADVGFAGLKDRRAVAIQWFSVPLARTAVDWAQVSGEGFRVLEARPHSRKLRRGAAAGNRFTIRLRQLEGDLGTLGPGFHDLASRGAPNYFGPQRFGRDAANLARVAEWLESGLMPRDRDQRGFLISTARSLVFNGVLAARVAAQDWDRLLPGEVVNLAGTGSVFHADTLDAALEERCHRADVHPTGPLPGRGGVLPAGRAREVETSALAPFQSVVAALQGADVDAARRPLRVVPGDLAWDLAADVLSVDFSLPRGAFATTVLREVLRFDAGEAPAED